MGTNEVTAAVTADAGGAEPERVQEPWERVGMTKADWDMLEIPAFLQRRGSECPTSGPNLPSAKHPDGPTPCPQTSATAPAAAACDGNTSGNATSTSIVGATGDFMQFRVDPAEIETKIKTEADRRWRNWVPTKTDRKRPRKSWYEKQVRREYYP